MYLRKISIVCILVCLCVQNLFAQDEMVETHAIPRSMTAGVPLEIPDVWILTYYAGSFLGLHSEHTDVRLWARVQTLPVASERFRSSEAVSRHYTHFAKGTTQVLPHPVYLVKAQSFLMKGSRKQEVTDPDNCRIYYFVEIAIDFGQPLLFLMISADYPFSAQVNTAILEIFHGFSTIDSLPVISQDAEFTEIPDALLQKPVPEEEQKEQKEQKNQKRLYRDRHFEVS